MIYKHALSPLALQKADADQRTVDDGSNAGSDGVQL